jgi:AraC-like DNA-binding protein
VVLAGARPRSPPFVDVVRRDAIALVEARLGTGDVSVKELCRVLKVSRNRLFRAFQPDGGIETFILTERLTRARTALGDVARDERIGGLAHRLGFSDSSHLSRAFRTRFGMTPTEYRALVLKNTREANDVLGQNAGS